MLLESLLERQRLVKGKHHKGGALESQPPRACGNGGKRFKGLLPFGVGCRDASGRQAEIAGAKVMLRHRVGDAIQV